MPNEQEKFLEELEKTDKVDILEQPLNEAPEKEAEDTVKQKDDEDAGELKPRNRRERRLMDKLAAERESSMFLAGKLEARTEAGKAVTEESDYLKSVERIYGTDSPEAQLATDLLKKALVGVREDAENRAYERIQAERQQETAKEREAEQTLDNMIDDIEDEYGVTLTEAQERSYFQLLEKMSPKDKQGNVVEYADAHAVWDVFQERLTKRGTDTRAKDLSARSMVQSGASKESRLVDDANDRFLKENGII